MVSDSILINGYKYKADDIFYLMKKHYCPKCNAKVKKTLVSKIVNSNSLEAKNYDFSNYDFGRMKGDVKFYWHDFLCLDCGKQITVGEMKRYEGISSRKISFTKLMRIITWTIVAIFFIVELVKSF